VNILIFCFIIAFILFNNKCNCFQHINAPMPIFEDILAILQSIKIIYTKTPIRFMIAILDGQHTETISNMISNNGIFAKFETYIFHFILNKGCLNNGLVVDVGVNLGLKK